MSCQHFKTKSRFSFLESSYPFLSKWKGNENEDSIVKTGYEMISKRDSINRLACYNFFTLSLNPYVYDNVLVHLYFTKMQTHVF